MRAASLPRWPSVLGPALFDNRLEGELHWRVAHGGDAPQDAPAMPAFGAALSDDDIWRVLDYLRLQAYGLSGGRACRRCRRRPWRCRAGMAERPG